MTTAVLDVRVLVGRCVSLLFLLRISLDGVVRVLLLLLTARTQSVQENSARCSDSMFMIFFSVLIFFICFI